MPDIFRDNWATASVLKDGTEIGPLRFTRLEYEGGGQDVARYRPHRTNGQFGEDQGRQPLLISGEMLFFRDLVARDPDLYPNRLIQMNQARSKAGPLDFSTPDKGVYSGRFTEWRETFGADQRNGCRVAFKFEEFADDEQAAGLGALEPMTRALEAAGRADAGLQLLGIAPPGPSLTLEVEALQGLLDNVMTFRSRVEAKLTSLQAKIDKVLRLKDVADPLNYQVYAAVVEVKAYVEKAVEVAQSDAPQLIPFILENGNSGPASLAMQIYKDENRADDITQNNPMRYFAYTQGTTLYVPNR